MDYKGSEVKAGIFIVVSFVLFMAVLFIIMGLDAWKAETTYRTRFLYVGGLQAGSDVRYAGLEVGSVKSVKLIGGGVPGAEVVFAVDPETPVKTDSKAYMTTVGILGEPYVEISSGSPDAPLAEEGRLLQSEDVPGFAQMSGEASELVEEITRLTNTVIELLNQQNQQYITDILASTRELTTSTSDNMEAMLLQVTALVGEAQKTLQSVNQLLNENQQYVSGSLQHMDTLLVETRGVVADLNTTISDMDAAILENRPQIEQILNNLASTSMHLDEFSRTLKERPWNAVRKSYPPQRAIEK